MRDSETPIQAHRGEAGRGPLGVNSALLALDELGITQREMKWHINAISTEKASVRAGRQQEGGWGSCQ